MAQERFSPFLVSNDVWMQQLTAQLPGEIIDEHYETKKFDNQTQQFGVLTRTRSGQEDLCLAIAKTTDNWADACVVINASDNWDLENNTQERSITICGVDNIIVPEGISNGSIEIVTELDNFAVITPDGKYAIRSQYYKPSPKMDKAIIWEPHDTDKELWRSELTKILSIKRSLPKAKGGLFGRLALEKNESTNLAVVRNPHSHKPSFVVRLEIESLDRKREKIWMKDVNGIYLSGKEVMFESNNLVTGRVSQLIINKYGDYLFTSDANFCPSRSLKDIKN